MALNPVDDHVLVLVLGGTRSGKSALAERLVSQLAAVDDRPVTYVATAWVDPDDADHAARVAAHRARRPAGWATVECTVPDDLPGVLAGLSGPVLLDSLGTWVAGLPDLAPPPALLDALVGGLLDRPGDTVVVSEEVGLSLHAPTEAGRRFVDGLGATNQAVSAVAHRAVLVVAGRALTLPPYAGPT